MSLNNKQCKSCRYYHGKKYGNDFLVCGLHPTGQENCPDRQKRIQLRLQKFLKILIILFKLFSFTYLVNCLLTIPLFGFINLSKSLFDSYLQKTPIINVSSLFVFCVTFIALGIAYLEYQLVKNYLHQVSEKICQNIAEDRVIIDWLEARDLTNVLEEVKALGILLGFLTVLGIHKMLYYPN